jgi:hypothetical protein
MPVLIYFSSNIAGVPHALRGDTGLLELRVIHTKRRGNFIIHAQTNKCTLTNWYIFYCQHLVVSVTPVAIYRVFHSINTRSTTEII